MRRRERGFPAEPRGHAALCPRPPVARRYQARGSAHRHPPEQIIRPGQSWPHLVFLLVFPLVFPLVFQAVPPRDRSQDRWPCEADR